MPATYLCCLVNLMLSGKPEIAYIDVTPQFLYFFGMIMIYIYGNLVISRERNIYFMYVYKCQYTHHTQLPFQCKHLLAIKLGLAMEKVKEQEVTDEVMTDIIKHIE